MAEADSEVVTDNSHQTEVRNDEVLKDNTLLEKISWYFQPLFPVYEVIKVSNAYAERIFGALETTISRLLSVFEREDPSHEKVEVSALNPVIGSLFKIWFQAHKNLRQSIFYIEGLYEEIIPLIPGQDPPFTNMDVQSMTIRAMCCHATLHMICRLPYHTMIFVSRIFKRVKNFILNPTEPINWSE